MLANFGSDQNTSNLVSYPHSTQNLVLDCSGTTDNLFASSQISISADFGTGPQAASLINGVASKFNTSFAKPGIYPVHVVAKNPDGLPQVLDFQIVVTCADGQYPPLTIDPSKITVSQSGDPNQFTYNASAAVSGGTGQYSYSWDFNGAGAFDLYENNPNAAWVAPILWNTSPMANGVYTAFAGTRTVRLAIRDTVCETTQTASTSINFNIPRVPAGSSIPVSVIKPNYFLQGDVAQPTPTLLNSNGQFIAILTPQMAQQGRKKHVDCGYAKAKVGDQGAMSIYGIDFFDTDAQQKAEHGISLKINNIADTGSTGTQTFNSQNGDSLTLENAAYITADAADAASRLTYNQVGACQVELILNRSKAVTPCAGDAQTVASDVIMIDGKYNCPTLRTSATQGTQEVSIQNGYFYCEVAYTNECPGGGGGGGGGIPPRPY